MYVCNHRPIRGIPAALVIVVRRTKEAAAATREQLLEAAERVFRERGVTRTSLDNIATAAGVTRGAVYWHFRDKADLVDAMCARATSPMQTLLERASEATDGDALASLRNVCVHALTHLAGDARAQAFFEIIFHKSESIGEMGALTQQHERECAKARDRIAAIIRRAVAARELPSNTDAEIAAHGVHAFVIGLMHEWLIDPRSYDLKSAAPSLIDLLIAGLRTCPPTRGQRSRRRPASASAGRTPAGPKTGE